MDYPMHNGSIYLCSNLHIVLTPGIQRCAILRDEFKSFSAGEGDKNMFASVITYIVKDPDKYPCLIRGSIKIDGQEYGVFERSGNTTKLTLIPTPWRDAIVELEFSKCSTRG